MSPFFLLVKTEIYWRVLGAFFGGKQPVDLKICDAHQRSFDQLRRPESR